jgi:hypothetical protein
MKHAFPMKAETRGPRGRGGWGGRVPWGAKRKYLRAKIRKIFSREACTLLRRAMNLFPTASSNPFIS